MNIPLQNPLSQCTIMGVGMKINTQIFPISMVFEFQIEKCGYLRIFHFQGMSMQTTFKNFQYISAS